MSENEKKLDQNQDQQKTTYSLNDDRRVKTLSPGAMVTKRFFRNRIAVIGMIILIGMSAVPFRPTASRSSFIARTVRSRSTPASR